MCAAGKVTISQIPYTQQAEQEPYCIDGGVCHMKTGLEVRWKHGLQPVA